MSLNSHLTQLQHQPQECRVIRWCFEGEMTGSTSETMLRWVEHLLEASTATKPSRKRAFRCAVEVIQNLEKHATTGMFAFSLDGLDVAVISSANAVDAQQASVLKEALKEAQSRPLEALRAQRLEKLAHGARTEKGGAGLGFLDLRTCSEGKVYTEFISCQDKQVLFALTVKVHLTS